MHVCFLTDVASNVCADTLDKSKVTGLEPVDKAQDSVNGLVSGQVGQGGLLQPVGDAASNEGFNRAERGGKDDQGSYMGSAASKASEYGGSAAGKVGGMFSTGSKDEKSNGGEKSN